MRRKEEEEAVEGKINGDSGSSACCKELITGNEKLVESDVNEKTR